jgi:hypothetical protein
MPKKLAKTCLPCKPFDVMGSEVKKLASTQGFPAEAQGLFLSSLPQTISQHVYYSVHILFQESVPKKKGILSV